MDATLSECEELLRDTSRRFATDFACRAVADYKGYDSSKAWSALAELGLLGLRWTTAGDRAGSTLDEAIVVESLAHQALPVPYLGGAAFVSGLLVAANAPADTMRRFADGEVRFAVVLSQDLGELWDVATPGSQPPIAFDCAGATAALVLDSSQGGPRLRTVAIGAELQSLDITRGLHHVDVGTSVDLGSLGGVIDPLIHQETVARFLVHLSADTVGVIEAALEAAVSYAATREQFGVPIATFQAIQHICADQLVSIEASRSLTEYAAWALDECDLSDAVIAAESAKAYASRAGREVCEAVVQVHGGVGFTWDFMAHVFLKRALLNGLVLGNSAFHLDAIARHRDLVAL